MTNFKKLLMFSALCFSFQACSGDEIEWNGIWDIPDDGNIYIVTQTRIIYTTITITGTLEIRTYGQIQNNGTIENDGVLAVKNNRWINNNSGATINNNSGGTLDNHYGKVYCNSGSTFNNNSGSTINNYSSFYCYSGSTFNNNSGSTINNSSIFRNYITLTNNGTITNNSGGYLYNHSGSTLNNNETITNNSGGFFFSYAPINNSGTITNNSGASITNASGSILNNNSGGTITNSGSFFSGATLNNNPGATFSHNADTIANNANLNNTGGTFEILGGTIDNGYNLGTGTINVSSGTLVINGGSLVKGYLGTSKVTIFGANLDGISTVISSGTLTLPAGKTMTIPSGSNFETGPIGTLTNNGTVTVFGILTNNGTYNNNDIFMLLLGGVFINNGIFNTSSGSFLDLSQTVITVPAGTTTIIEPGLTYIISDGQRLNVEGRLLNQSDDSIDVYGNVYTYSIIENGDGSNAGTLNVHHGGNLFMLGGELENGNGGSKINVNAGGSLYNYHGTIDTDLGDLKIFSGGKFDNVRGNYPNTLTINSGGFFLDASQVQMEKNLDIDYTWTITEKVVLYGNGNEITFGDNGKIVIDGSNASLLLQDVILNDVSGNKVRCTDSNTTLSIDNVVWNMDGDFTFDTGKFYVSGDWLITGTYKFIYETDQVSTITSNATLHLLLSTFDYNAGSNNLINMIDNTSQVHLEYGTLLASQDFTLENGSIFVTSLGTLNGDTELDLQNIDSINIAGSLRRLGSVTI